MVKVISTTSAKLGVRIGGMQVVLYAFYINLVKLDIICNSNYVHALGFIKTKIQTKEANVHNFKKCFEFYNNFGHDNKSSLV